MYIDIGLGKKSVNKGYPSILSEDFNPNLFQKLRHKFNPFWLTVNQSAALNQIYEENPVLFMVLEKKATFASNVEIDVRDLKTGKIYKKNKPVAGEKIPDLAQRMLNLIYNPNPFQSKSEFIKQNVIFHELHGNSYEFANFSSFSQLDITTINSLKNLWPHCIKPEMNRNGFLTATQETDIIKYWAYSGLDNLNKQISPAEILHRKNVNTKLDTVEDFILGKSKVIPLYRPLSNIHVNYEAKNEIGENRGMSTIISSKSTSPQLGSLPMTKSEKKDTQEELKNYGTRSGQSRFMITKTPIDVFQLDQDIRKLALTESIAADTMAVCHTFGVAEILLKMYEAGVTYENLTAGERQTYLNTTIPETNDWIEDINVWLKTRVYGFEYVTNFDHIKVLQENEKERAIINRNNSVTFREGFVGGACTQNEWRLSMGLTAGTEKYDDMRIYMMPEDVRFTLTGRTEINANNDLKNQANNNPDAK